MTIPPQDPQPPTAPSIHGKLPRGIAVIPQSPFYQGRFGRLFRKLPPLALEDGQLAALAQTMVEQPGSPSGDNPDIPSGYTYLGQFIDHDITFDPTSKLQRDNDPDALRNFRTPRFDLDSLYGRGPEDSPFMYQADGLRLALGRTVEGEEDCPRFSPPGTEGVDTPDARRSRRALLGDPRNDENVIVSQLHLAFIKYHNAVVDELGRGGTLDRGALFEEACRVVRWHYQWLVIHDFLRRLVGGELVAHLFRKNSYKVFAPTKSSGQLRNAALWEPDLKFFRWREQPYIPVEFSVAAYRFGHSQVRSTYKLNDQTAAGDIPIFAQTADEFGDLRGSRERPRAWQIAWERFFGVGDPAKLQLSKAIDTRLAPGLHTLPLPEMPSLAERNLRRGQALGLPSGQDVARAMGLPKALILRGDDLGLSPNLTSAFGDHTPLWYYILKEAEIHSEGKQLGAVGGRIVAEVFVGLLAGDPLSYLYANDNVYSPEDDSEGWAPRAGAFGAPADRVFTVADLLKFAGVKLTETNPESPPSSWQG